MWLGNFVRLALLIFLAVNLYAVALRFFPVPTTILMMQRGLSGEDIKRDWTRLEDISPFVVEAVMGGEDSRFCEHEGIDWEAIEQAFEDNQEGGRRRGGSTITQQTAKNVFFWNGGGYVRKAGEAWFASLIDFAWGKPRVMEVYLNVAEWGDGVFGIEAAAQARFGKSANKLSQQEAALLAAVLPSPNKWRLDPPTKFVRGRAGTLRKRMAVIRNSNYASCVVELRPIEIAPESSAPQTPNAEADTAPAPAPETKVTLEEVLDAAKQSLPQDSAKEKDDIDMTKTDMTDTSLQSQTPQPQLLGQTPPVEIPPIDPATIPKTPNEIAPDVTPEAPRDIPQEIPVQNPPAEIPQRIDTPRVPPED
ncbi:monofunctional biosynthetic peptidoglycan transglycosylase [Hellea balneolensis]|uniref:monofunctional biosynthetic peptidoglycan transglycosylase n=1 Tax=Hellea balneolensis TaxID=287478 RepID=UPI0003F87A07|nr:monofunctional biosynthetic peptidoglycan transglycosylase [Hellea balneolensis]